jgi:membrane protein YqaA with SNARE-associated domain
MNTRLLTVQNIASSVAIVGIFVAAVALAQWLSTSAEAVSLTERFGYAGLLVVGIVTGLNFIIPIPAATFSALYSAAGLALPGIILALALGTLIADMIGFWVGTKLRRLVDESYPTISHFAHQAAARRYHILFVFVMLYAALVPFPNEAILIPLAVAGIKLKYLLLPLIIGNMLHQTILLLGIDTLTRFLF